MLKILAGAFVVLVMAAVVVGLMALLLWWLVPLAFPALAFGFPNALALAVLLLIFVGIPACT